MKLKEMLRDELPREKLKRLGVQYLSDSELLSIILRTGNKNESVNELSNRVLKEIGGISYLKDMTVNSLSKISGIKLSKASIIVASFELARRSIVNKEKYSYKSTSDIYNLIKSDFYNLNQEKFLILLFDVKLNFITKKELFVGTINEITISPREIFKEALRENASNIVLVHNHPSGDMTPSDIDDITTKQLIDIGTIMKIKILDHIIIGNNSYFSYYENMHK